MGILVNFTGAEWRHLGVRTVTPVDMTEEERKDFNRIRRNGRRRKKRRLNGMKTRPEYLAAASIGEPWKAERISRRTWYRRRTKAGTGMANIYSYSLNQTCVSKEGLSGVASPTLRSPTQLPLCPDVCQRLYALGLLHDLPLLSEAA